MQLLCSIADIPTDDDDDSNTGAIIGGVIGGILGAILLVVIIILVVYCCCYRNSEKGSRPSKMMHIVVSSVQVAVSGTQSVNFHALGHKLFLARILR